MSVIVKHFECHYVEYLASVIRDYLYKLEQGESVSHKHPSQFYTVTQSCQTTLQLWLRKQMYMNSLYIGLRAIRGYVYISEPAR